MITPELEHEAKEKLRIFIISTEYLIDSLVENREVYFNRNYSSQIINSWQELKSDLHFNKLLDSLMTISRDKLEKEGLYGEQLNFKLSVYDDAINDFRKKNKSDKKDILKKIFKMLNSIIESLIDALGGGGAIKEFKEFLEINMD